MTTTKPTYLWTSLGKDQFFLERHDEDGQDTIADVLTNEHAWRFHLWEREGRDPGRFATVDEAKAACEKALGVTVDQPTIKWLQSGYGQMLAEIGGCVVAKMNLDTKGQWFWWRLDVKRVKGVFATLDEAKADVEEDFRKVPAHLSEGQPEIVADDVVADVKLSPEKMAELKDILKTLPPGSWRFISNTPPAREDVEARPATVSACNWCHHCGAPMPLHIKSTICEPCRKYREGSRCEETAEAETRPAVAKDRQVGGDHYRSMKIQVCEFIHANDIGHREAAAIERLVRWKRKDGIQDLHKAIHEIELLIEMETGKGRA